MKNDKKTKITTIFQNLRQRNGLRNSLQDFLELATLTVSNIFVYLLSLYETRTLPPGKSEKSTFASSNVLLFLNIPHLRFIIYYFPFGDL